MIEIKYVLRNWVVQIYHSAAYEWSKYAAMEHMPHPLYYGLTALSTDSI